MVNDLYVLPSFTVKVSDARAAVVVVVFVAVKRERETKEFYRLFLSFGEREKCYRLIKRDF